MAISETWLGCEATNDTTINSLLPSGYSIIHVDRNSNQRGAGVALIFKEHLHLKLFETITFKQFEFMKCTMTLANKNIDILVFYRPPASISNQLSTTAFIDEWSDFIAQHSISKSELIIIGDVNLHLDDAKNHKTLRFLQTLESHSLLQHIHVPTHYQGHTLDTLITRDDSTLLFEIEVVDIGLCNDQGVVLRDHYAISCKIQL